MLLRAVAKEALFGHLVGRWRDLFNAKFDVPLYDLTSTYFEADPPSPDSDKRRFVICLTAGAERAMILLVFTCFQTSAALTPII